MLSFSSTRLSSERSSSLVAGLYGVIEMTLSLMLLLYPFHSGEGFLLVSYMRFPLGLNRG
jgi:hypothetical protein